MTEPKESARAHFAKLLRERGITPEDMKLYREIGELADLAKKRADKGCTGAGDKCEVGHDCHYKEGGCGNDECCNVCDSCMLTWDTCSSSQTCPNEG